MATKKELGEGLGIAGMTLGIIAIISAGIGGLLLSIIGFILSYKQQKINPTRIGKAGVVLNLIAFVLSVVFLIAWVFLLRNLTLQNPLA